MPDSSSLAPQLLDYEATLAQLQAWAEAGIPLGMDRKKHLLGQYDEQGEPMFELKLPLPFPPITEDDLDLHSYLARIPEEPPSYVIMLIQLGAAALGYFEAGEVVFHKAIKKYMKRQKRGKAQISYLNTRGKSKAGSRIRLANTVRFFEEINERLNEWEEDLEPQRILYSCTPQLWGLLFASQVPPPFEKKDSRLIKVPTHVHVPDHEELMRINEFALQGRLWQYDSA